MFSGLSTGNTKARSTIKVVLFSTFIIE